MPFCEKNKLLITDCDVEESSGSVQLDWRKRYFEETRAQKHGLYSARLSISIFPNLKTQLILSIYDSAHVPPNDKKDEHFYIHSRSGPGG
jgi:hypothetical protein